MRKQHWYTALTFVMALIFALGAVTVSAAPGGPPVGEWLSGDFHTHTYLTDGDKTQADVVGYAFTQFGLDWMANSEHGGSYARDPNGAPWTSSAYLLPETPLRSDGRMWRWLSLKYYSFPIVAQLRAQYPDNLIFQGVEWNVPTHEHASVGIIADDATAISDFEYMFDQSDGDTSRAPMPKQNRTHEDAVAAAAWLQANYPTTSYFLINHPSRKLAYSAAAIRDFNNAAPDVAFGLEGLPGHQKEAWRGGYGNNYGSSTPLARTYGGADYMLAPVGGLMDSLWGEGRRFWVFVNSDFHDSAADADFWPGEYAKSHTFAADRSYQAIVDGMRSGKTFAVHGDLINALDFTAKSKNARVAMGQTLVVDKGEAVLIKIRFRSPASNYCGGTPIVDHVDLIAGDITGMAQPGTDAYASAVNPSAKVVARFSRSNFRTDNEGWNVATFVIRKAETSQYFRLRGSNLGLNVPGETDADGNPLVDTLTEASNSAEKACADLWFYSNPVFVQVR